MSHTMITRSEGLMAASAADAPAHRNTSPVQPGTVDVLLVAGNDKPCGERSTYLALEKFARLMVRAYVAYVATLATETR